MTVPSGEEKSAASRSPMTMPGHRRVPEEHQRGDADADRRPQRRHRAVQIGQAQADLRGAVVQRRQEGDRSAQEHEPSRARGTPGRELRIHPGVTGC